MIRKAWLKLYDRRPQPMAGGTREIGKKCGQMKPVRWPDWHEVDIESGNEDERGGSLIEVLVSMLILLFVLVGVLQLFVMSVAVERLTEAQSELMGKARSVIEIVRLVNATGAAGNSGVLPLTVGRRTLPLTSGDTGFDFWGPAGFDIVDQKSRFQVEYEITDAGPEWLVTVFAIPKTAASSQVYLSSAGKKGVRYAARISK